jgi:hypothetical protein
MVHMLEKSPLVRFAEKMLPKREKPVRAKPTEPVNPGWWTLHLDHLKCLPAKTTIDKKPLNLIATLVMWAHFLALPSLSIADIFPALSLLAIPGYLYIFGAIISIPTVLLTVGGCYFAKRKLDDKDRVYYATQAFLVTIAASLSVVIICSGILDLHNLTITTVVAFHVALIVYFGIVFIGTKPQKNQ